ncbi:hypothetical protein MTHERMMSTA1_03050 [Methanosarcina thermophila MST-A1]|uniref:Uncharacterized protein n=1 Tax=Methanosarcina thermophila TaxID=2210 RepID=A0A3G9CQU8_METTE|nr:conserved hypothetical protein [Methanosarcina thermophila]GLI13179.1 hypothetical protein MTHERMMSTA1_03050 [Methanosarcina thermophila MST-A1]
MLNCVYLPFSGVTQAWLQAMSGFNFVFLNLSSELIIEFIQKFSLRLLSQAEIGSHMEIF